MAVSELSPMTQTEAASPLSPYKNRMQVYSRNSNNQVTKVYHGNTISTLYDGEDATSGDPRRLTSDQSKTS